MRIIQKKHILRDFVNAEHRQGRKIGVVLTMGSLHQGHLSLIDAIRKDVDTCIVTSFVNPVQFNDPKDFQNYPKDFEEDVNLLQNTGDVDIFYVPSNEDIYPSGFLTSIDVGAIGNVLCGMDRPGHFNGVALVVTKLLMQTGADIAAFGEKDYQQLCILRHVVRDLDIDTTIRAVPTFRHDDGLAYSSRNKRLTPALRKKATLIPKTMKTSLKRLQQGQAVEDVIEEGKKKLRDNGLIVHYFQLCDAVSLKQKKDAAIGDRLFVAANLGPIRLIDNMECS